MPFQNHFDQMSKDFLLTTYVRLANQCSVGKAKLMPMFVLEDSTPVLRAETASEASVFFPNYEFKFLKNIKPAFIPFNCATKSL